MTQAVTMLGKQAVLDGDLDGFIQAYLKSTIGST